MDVLTALLQALEATSPTHLETALDSAFHQGLTPELVPSLTTLLLAPWHQRHEDIARALQILRDDRSTPALAIVARQKHDYLVYNQSQALARKCIWALADIGTVTARALLENLAGCDDAIVAGYAQRRLSLWEEELGRKAISGSKSTSAGSAVTHTWADTSQR